MGWQENVVLQYSTVQYSTVQYLLSLINALSIMHIVIYRCDVPRFDSTVAFKLLTKYIMDKVK